jgi:hypothetical protein
MSYAIVCVPTEHCRGVWERVKPYLEPAIEATNGRWTPDYVLAALVLNEQSLWVIMKDNLIVGAATTQLITYPTKKAIAIHYLGGSGFDEWYPELLKTISAAGKAQGCDTIESLARFGFWNWFKNDGFEKTSCFYEKAI